MLLKLQHVSKHYQLGDTLIKAMNDVSLEIEEGEFVAIMGPSGSGKSTFLQVASILAVPTSGSILLRDRDLTQYNEVERAKLRNKSIGFIFQQFNLLARTSALDNVGLPLLYAKVSQEDRVKRSKAMLEKVGLGDRLQNTPAQLSGGQQQRVAIARALVNDPDLIFADEPTGNLDSKSGDDIKKLLSDLHKEGRTIIMVTHEDDVAEIANRLIVFHDGEVISDTKQKSKKKKTTGKRKAK
ncbi:MAG: macrolide ABC transporter ATP-binding protein [Candidatus Pacebacteria bacterium CG_4_10_14_0_8_um_filter_42_14]|nr:MAG: macrolide ABC transporter ATP-binding protein [Candidatus Pacebacteria bacterium CG_4_10_14_0_8_um_filter_42_14]